MTKSRIWTLIVLVVAGTALAGCAANEGGEEAVGDNDTIGEDTTTPDPFGPITDDGRVANDTAGDDTTTGGAGNDGADEDVTGTDTVGAPESDTPPDEAAEPGTYG